VSPPFKLLFDECVAKPLMAPLVALMTYAKPPAEIAHTIDFFKSGTQDESWIPEVADDDWIIITGDRGSRGGRKRGEKLPLVCKQYGVTHVMLGGKLQQQSSFHKFRAVVWAWDDLATLPLRPKGSGWSLRIGPAGYPRLEARRPAAL